MPASTLEIRTTAVQPMPPLPPLASPGLHSARLRLDAGHPGLAEAVLDYQRRNLDHFSRWDPPLPADYLTLAAQQQRLAQGLQAFQDGTALRWWLMEAGTSELSLACGQVRILGQIHFNQISRGAFHSCVLGYSLDQEAQGRGLMSEALACTLAEVFSPRVNLHRVQAAYRQENLRSGAVLRRAGFQDEGLARGYLFIDGDWRDHRIVSLRNDRFRRPADWPQA